MQAYKTIPKVPFISFLRRSLEILKNPLPFHRDNFERLGDTFQLQIGLRQKVIFSRNPEYLRYVLQTNQRNYTKSDIQTKEVAKYMGKGLLTSEGELWKRQRKLLQPTFHKKHLVKLLLTIQDTIVGELENIPEGKPHDIEKVFSQLAFQVVAKSLFSGIVSNAEINRLKEITENAQRMLVKELRQPYLGWWFTYGGVLKAQFDEIAEARQLIKKLIAQRRQEGSQNNDLLDMLLAARYEDGTAMEEDQMVDEILILFTAGHETTSNALTFACQLLAKHPEYQEAIYQENNTIEGPDIMTGLMAQKITKQVLEETMRLYPPAYFIDRKNLEEDTLGAFHFEKGSSLLFSIVEIHRHTDYWEDPLAFKPERFDGPPKQHSAYYYPFGAGPRMCIGNNFAFFEMQLAITALIKRFTIGPKNDAIEILPLITLKPKNAFLTFKRR